MRRWEFEYNSTTRQRGLTTKSYQNNKRRKHTRRIKYGGSLVRWLRRVLVIHYDIIRLYDTLILTKCVSSCGGLVSWVLGPSQVGFSEEVHELHGGKATYVQFLLEALLSDSSITRKVRRKAERTRQLQRCNHSSSNYDNRRGSNETCWALYCCRVRRHETSSKASRARRCMYEGRGTHEHQDEHHTTGNGRNLKFNSNFDSSIWQSGSTWQ